MTEKVEGNGGVSDAEEGEGAVVERWTSPFGAENDRRKTALEAMKGFQIKVDIEALGRSGHVMYKNAEELGRHAETFLRERNLTSEVSDDYEKELVRYLHNYLTSIYSLIEAQRVVMRHCWGESSEFELGDYAARRKATFETGEAEFMTELRNYSTHRSIPLPGMSTKLSWSQGGATVLQKKLTLNRDALLKWKKWTGPAKLYLSAKEERFDLGLVIQSYVNAASAFFNWFVNEISERNAADLAAYRAAAEEYVEWYREENGMNTEGYRRLFGPPPGGGDGNAGNANRAQRRSQQKQSRRTTKQGRRKRK